MAKSRGKPEELEEYRSKRDFSRTSEPAGGTASPDADGRLRFVIQKHAASHLHFDLRLEMEGVMRSWAVPRGPTLDPAARRLAMEVEDHPIEYNEFEGTIPKGEYGGGTVMLWDRGSWEPKDAKKKETAEQAALRGYREGKIGIRFFGERMHGKWNLVRTHEEEGGPRSKWLFFKLKDEFADPSNDISETIETSVATGRTMDEIAEGVGGDRVWHSNRGDGDGGEEEIDEEPVEIGSLEPMLARPSDQPPTGSNWIFEPKYDGIRILALVTPGGAALVTRNGHDKAKQFPEVRRALERFARKLDRPVVLDGEIVALEEGRIVRFENLQNRMHLTSASRIRTLSEEEPAAIVLFDVLLEGDEVVLGDSWTDRRARLERLFAEADDETLRISEVEEDSGALLKRARQAGWEGLIAKQRNAPYRPGERSRSWLKVKVENRQEFVVGGWTDPRRSRPHFGALLLGYYDDDGKLQHAGQVGSGFNGSDLGTLAAKMAKLERKSSPFVDKPPTNSPAHWVTPKLVVEVKFSEWTSEGRLRHPVYLGLRDDKDPGEVRREPLSSRSGGTGKKAAPAADSWKPENPQLVERIGELEKRKKDGAIELPDGTRLAVTSMAKVFYPETGHTKGDLMAYYARMGGLIMPFMRDRPLVLKRFPNGVEEEAFYQQAAPDSPPAGVRVEEVDVEGKAQRRLVGGDLATLLYTVQLGAISYDPWHSSMGRFEYADYTILDLDPGPGADFQTAKAVARVVREEMEKLEVHGALKTSGSRGLHIYLPLPPETPLEAATLISQIIATRVARRIPEIATIERMTKNRPHGTVYVDYLQNILGKTVAGVYAARAKPEPTVSTPLRWDELTDELDLRAFTIDTVPGRVEKIGDLWGPAMAEPISLEKMLRRQGG